MRREVTRREVWQDSFLVERIRSQEVVAWGRNSGRKAVYNDDGHCRGVSRFLIGYHEVAKYNNAAVPGMDGVSLVAEAG